MDVKVVTKVGCPRCLLLKDKLHRLDVAYTEATDWPVPEGAHLPLVIIDGEPYEYAAAMKKLKEAKGGAAADA